MKVLKDLFLFKNLQLFAVADYTQKTTDSEISYEMKEYYDTSLLKNILPKLVFQQFGKKQELPKNNGKTVEWRKFSDLAKATTPLQEGITPDGHKFHVNHVTATIKSYGDYTIVTDVLKLTTIDPFITEATKKHAENAALTIDTITRNALLGTTNVMYAPKSNGTPVTSRSGLDITCNITPKLIAKAVANLKRKNAPTFNGDYVMVVHPSIEFDLITHEKWIDVEKYTEPNAKNIFNGEIGKLYGVRFVRTTEAPVFAPTERTTETEDILAVYGCLCFGKDAYGVVDLEGGGLEMIIKSTDAGGVENALNQRGSIGWKVIGYAAAILNPDYLINVECTSSEFSLTDVSNDTPADANLPTAA